MDRTTSCSARGPGGGRHHRTGRERCSGRSGRSDTRCCASTTAATPRPRPGCAPACPSARSPSGWATASRRWCRPTSVHSKATSRSPTIESTRSGFTRRGSRWPGAIGLRLGPASSRSDGCGRERVHGRLRADRVLRPARSGCQHRRGVRGSGPQRRRGPSLVRRPASTRRGHELPRRRRRSARRRVDRTARPSVASSGSSVSS